MLFPPCFFGALWKRGYSPTTCGEPHAAVCRRMPPEWGRGAGAWAQGPMARSSHWSGRRAGSGSRPQVHPPPTPPDPVHPRTQAAQAEQRLWAEILRFGCGFGLLVGAGPRLGQGFPAVQYAWVPFTMHVALLFSSRQPPPALGTPGPAACSAKGQGPALWAPAKGSLSYPAGVVWPRRVNFVCFKNPRTRTRCYTTPWFINLEVEKLLGTQCRPSPFWAPRKKEPTQREP